MVQCHRSAFRSLSVGFVLRHSCGCICSFTRNTSPHGPKRFACVCPCLSSRVAAVSPPSALAFHGHHFLHGPRHLSWHFIHYHPLPFMGKAYPTRLCLRLLLSFFKCDCFTPARAAFSRVCLFYLFLETTVTSILSGNASKFAGSVQGALNHTRRAKPLAFIDTPDDSGMAALHYAVRCAPTSVLTESEKKRGMTVPKKNS